MRHEVKHMGFSELRGKKDEAVAHLALANGWPLQGAFDYVDEAFDVWRERSRHAWQLDISWLETQGIRLQDETAAEGDNLPADNQLSLELEVAPVATESTAVPAVMEQQSISRDERPILKDNPLSRTSSVGSTLWSVCQRVFCLVKKVIRDQW